MYKKIFLSYNWNNKNIADSIDSAFAGLPITIVRDERNLKYKQSIKEFMKKIRDSDYAIMLISDDYLKSSNCMFEVLEFIKDENYRNRIIPIIFGSTNIFSPEGRIYYLNYWADKYEELNKQLEKISPETCVPLFIDLKHYGQIKNEIAEFITVLSDMSNIVIESEISEKDIVKIKKYMELLKFEIIKVVLVIEKEKNQDINELYSLFNELEICSYETLNSSNYHATYLLKLYTDNINKFYERIRNCIKQINFKCVDCFDYCDSYYILCMRKTWEMGSEFVLWYSPLSKGYTENIQEAGVYSSEEVTKMMDSKIFAQSNDIIGVPKILYDKKVKLPSLLYKKEFLIKIEELQPYIIGDIYWERRDFYARPWDEVLSGEYKTRNL